MVDLVLEAALEWICLIFVTITLPIYVFLLLILIVYRKSSELKGAFFTLCISVGICDIVSMINNYIGYRFPYWGWGASFYLKGGPSLAKLFIFTAWALRMIQAIGVTLLAVNRATAVIWPFKYVKLWSPRMLKVAVGLQLLIGVIFAFPLVFQDYYWDIGNSSRLIITFRNSHFNDSYFVAAFFAQTAFALIISVSYASLIATLHWKKKNAIPQDENNSERQTRNIRDVKLAMMGSIVCFFEILWFIFVLYAGVISPLPTDVFFLIYDTLTDIYSGINPYLIFVFSSAVRDRIKTLLWNHQSSRVITMPTTRVFSSAQSPRSQSPAMHPIDHHVHVLLPGQS